ncbi:TonB-dependent receptor [Thiotrichales bacterium HSG1]|nr:TonB-dependent receptor [Thiotrichales bacterium HSG1]
MKYLQLLILITIFIVMPSNADNNQAELELINQLKNLALEELTEVKIFDPEAGLASRKVQRLSDTAAALFVITQEDIRRAGITHVAEALRLVPGVQVARIDANKWAITARGLNGQYSSKLLVMIDGRSVYTQLRSEVYWDVQDLLIEDIDHIEIIRGPGASLWGANAVNGVVNIITKSSKNTQGTLLATHFGNNEEKTVVGVRYGDKLDNGISYRVYGKFYDHENFLNVKGQEHNDNWDMKRGGFRLDWNKNEYDKITFQGDVYKGKNSQKILSIFTELGLSNPIIDDQINTEGFNLLGRWQRNFTNGDIILQTYLDHTERDDASLGEVRDTYDIDFQHRWQRNEKQEIIWGLGFRHTRDEIKSSTALIYSPEERGDNLFSAFLQGEFLLSDKFKLTTGIKLENNDYTGLEIQPTLRGLWTFNPKHSFWAAISQAVRTPSRTEADAKVVTIIPTNSLKIESTGSRDFNSEDLLAYELGYRFTIAKNFLLDTTVFFNKYDNLRSINLDSFDPLSATMVFKTNNKMYGEVFGLELANHWQILDNWRIVATYSYLQIQLHIEDNLTNVLTNTESEEDTSPHHQATLRSLFNITNDLEFDIGLYYVDNLPVNSLFQSDLLDIDIPEKNVTNYIRTDFRLGWKPMKNLDLGLGIRNLFDKQHVEFSDAFNGNTVIASEIPRTFYLQLKYLFE